ADALRAVLSSPDFHRHRIQEYREVGVPGTNTTAPTLLSSAEAAEVWSRAADLQANTGVLIPPPSFSVRGDAPLVTQGYDAALVKASAVEAGIDERYVDRAMIERQRVLAASPSAGAGSAAIVERAATNSATPNVFIGAPTKLEYNAHLEGELDSDAFEDIADEVRRTLGPSVNISAVGRTLTVNTLASVPQRGGARLVQVYVSSRNGQTQVRVTEDLAQLAGGLFIGLGIGGGIGAGALVTGLVVNATHTPALGIGALVGVLSVGYSVSRWLYQRAVTKRDAELRDLLTRVVDRARG
ncbi:MAG: hypothetical protein IT353_05145, partial [Gemmatimonadaceae bacterium]|nr:hypothetical protein [Gemmatimonadaceae bacterium]